MVFIAATENHLVQKGGWQIRQGQNHDEKHPPDKIADIPRIADTVAITVFSGKLFLLLLLSLSPEGRLPFAWALSL